ncbi:hypothetical protein GCM10027048_12540 [Hymenobacter coalescens]
MMQAYTKLLVSSVVLVGALLGGCAGKEGDPGPAGPSLTGSMVGFVNPTDENGVVQNRAGVTVTLDNTTPARTATSDVDGRFEFTALPTGTYNLTYTRQGYGSMRRVGVGHVGGDQPTFLGTTSVTQPSSVRVTNLSFGFPTPTAIPVNLTLTNTNPANATYRVMFFAGTTANVTAATGTLITTFIFNSAGQQNASLNKTAFTSAGFPVGSPVYVVAYASPAINPTYVDPQNGRVVYTGLSTSPSNTQGFVLQ